MNNFFLCEKKNHVSKNFFLFDKYENFLKKQSFKWPSLALPGPGTLDVKESAFVAIMDTETIYGAHCKELGNTASLGRALDSLKIDSWCLHNAGKLPYWQR